VPLDRFRRAEIGTPGTTATAWGGSVGSLSDIVFVTERDTSVKEVNNVFREEAQSKRHRRVLGVAEDPIVSSDIVGDSRASAIDLEMTRVVDGNLVKVMSWYDNEWGYTQQMIRQALEIAKSV
jgi:glyceraldehyde 3-phosphate dehydrogenase